MHFKKIKPFKYIWSALLHWLMESHYLPCRRTQLPKPSAPEPKNLHPNLWNWEIAAPSWRYSACISVTSYSSHPFSLHNLASTVFPSSDSITRRSAECSLDPSEILRFIFWQLHPNKTVIIHPIASIPSVSAKALSLAFSLYTSSQPACNSLYEINGNYTLIAAVRGRRVTEEISQVDEHVHQ